MFLCGDDEVVLKIIGANGAWQFQLGAVCSHQTCDIVFYWAPQEASYTTRSKVSLHSLTFMLRRTRSTRKCVFTGLASGGITPLE